MRIVAIACILLGIVSHAQARSTFEAMTFEPPAGFTVTSAPTGVTMQATDAKANTFGLVVITPSIPSAGSLDADFKAAWSKGVVATFGVKDAPAMQAGASDAGWTATSGSAKVALQGAQATVVLVAMTGHGRTMSVVLATNSAAYGPAIQGFLGSVKMAAPIAPPAATAEWTATAEADWVRVAKTGAIVLLHAPVPLDDASRRNIPGYFWNKLIAPRYRIAKLYGHEYDESRFPYHFEDADLADGSYVALRVVVANGVAYPIEIATAKATFAALFPDQAKIAAMLERNRFPIGGELEGTWSGATGATVAMYYVATGGYAGQNTAVTSDVFTFGSKGAFASKHAGATNGKTYSTAHAGTYTAAPWEITVTLSDGKVTTYSAYYEMVRDRRILHLTDKKYSGMSYALVRDK